jgi:hypothetical protein
VTSNKDNKRKNIGMNLYFFRGNTEKQRQIIYCRTNKNGKEIEECKEKGVYKKK